MWSNELLSYVLLLNTVIRFVSHTRQSVGWMLYKRSTHSHFVSIYIFIYKSFMFDGFFASFSLSSSIEPYLSLFLGILLFLLIFFSWCVSFYKHTLLCLAHSPYLEHFALQSTSLLCCKTVTHVVIDFICERNEFLLFYISSLKKRRTKRRRSKNIKQMKRTPLHWKRWAVLRIVRVVVVAPLKSDVSYCQFTWYSLQEARVCYPFGINDTYTVYTRRTHLPRCQRH